MYQCASARDLRVTPNPDTQTWIGFNKGDVATLRVADGTFTAGFVGVGQVPGAVGRITVASKTTLNFNIMDLGGVGGSGTIDVQDGGAIYSPDGAVFMGDYYGGLGNVTVDGSKSSFDVHQVTLGRGTLELKNGVQATSVVAELAMGSQTNYSATALISGAGTNWDLYRIELAHNGIAGLNVTDNATVTTSLLHIGEGPDRFTGFGSVAVESASLSTDVAKIGDTSRGNLTVLFGGQFTSNHASIGTAATGVSKVQVNWFSTWNNTAEIKVGDAGAGTLIVSNGSHVNGGTNPVLASQIGAQASGQGDVTVTGESSWSLSSPLYVGVFGDGALTIQKHSTVNNTKAAIGWIEGSTGHVTVANAGSVWTSSSTLTVGGDANFVGGTGELEIADSGLVKVGTTATVWETGAVHLNAGTLQATTINLSGGSLSGVGTVIGNLTNAGEVSPGNSPGTLKVQGNFTQSLDGLLKLEIASTASDLLQVTGNAKLGGTLHLSLLGGFTPHAGTTYDLLTASKLSGAFDTLELPDLGPGHSWQFSYGADRFSVTAVPEPSTMVLGAIGLAAIVGARARRRRYWA